MKQKNVMWMIGERFYYTIRYVFPLLQKLNIISFVFYFEKQRAACVLTSKMIIFSKDLLSTYKKNPKY